MRRIQRIELTHVVCPEGPATWLAVIVYDNDEEVDWLAVLTPEYAAYRAKYFINHNKWPKAPRKRKGT